MLPEPHDEKAVRTVVQNQAKSSVDKKVSMGYINFSNFIITLYYTIVKYPCTQTKHIQSAHYLLHTWVVFLFSPPYRQRYPPAWVIWCLFRFTLFSHSPLSLLSFIVYPDHFQLPHSSENSMKYITTAHVCCIHTFCFRRYNTREGAPRPTTHSVTNKARSLIMIVQCLA